MNEITTTDLSHATVTAAPQPMPQSYIDQYNDNHAQVVVILAGFTNAVIGMTPADEATYEELATVNSLMEKLTDIADEFGITF